MVTFGNKWQQMANFLQQMATFDNKLQLLITNGKFWQQMATFDNKWQQMATNGNFWQQMATLATNGNF